MTTPSSETEGELSLTISAYGYIEWRGPRAKLESIEVVPRHVKWPERINYAHWRAEGADFTLRRCRPDGLHGPMRGFKDCDFWFVRRTVLRPTAHMWTIYQPHVELGALLCQAVPCGEAIWIDFPKLHANERIKKLRARLVPDGTHC